ncbi:MAG: VOC family protein [Planctomycetes bacterium]|nr:VOC family protein [Planctomycetota bacterium]MCC7171949.1 VOC family protein [Planctomycetota bacterium]
MWKPVVVVVAAVMSVGYVAVAREDGAAKAPERKAVDIRWEGSVIAARVVKDLEASLRWYQDVLGCELFFDLRQGGWVELTTPVKDTLIGLQQAEPKQETVSAGDSTLMFGTADIVGAETWLKSHGVKTEPIVEIPQTVKLMTFFDPDGHRLQLHEPFKG